MKKAILMAAAALAWTTAAGAQPADWVTLQVSADIAKPAAQAWKLVGGEDWCGIAPYLNLKSCHIDKGTGEVGSERTINGRIHELAVARTPLSYTYAQPDAKNFYHGTMAVAPVDATHSRISYTMIWNAAALPTPEARARMHDGLRNSFQAAVDKMAAHANAAK